MKKRISMVMAVITAIAAISLTGCGNTEKPAVESEPAATSQIAESTTTTAAESIVEPETEPTQEVEPEPEVKPLPEEIEFEGFTYKTAGLDNIDPEAPLGETICTEEAKDLVIPEFPFKATPANIELWSEDGKKIFLPESASDDAMYMITTLTIRPDHTADIIELYHTSYKNTDNGPYYSAGISYENVTSDTRGYMGIAGSSKTSEYAFVSDTYSTCGTKNVTTHDLPISELPLIISHNIDTDSSTYVNFNKDGYFATNVENKAIRYNLTTNDPTVSKAYFYICGIDTNGVGNSVIYPIKDRDFLGLAVYLYNDGTISMSRLVLGTSIYDDASISYEKMPSEELATLDDLRSSDPEFDTAYTAWLDGKMPFMIPLDEYLEKYAPDTAN